MSVFPTLEGLYHYMLGKEADLDDCRIVELEGDGASDVDFDADQGAMLVVPTNVLRCVGPDHHLAAEVRERTAEITQGSPAQP